MTTRQSISFTEPNANWLSAQLDSNEYTSKSEAINDLIRKARAKEAEIEIIRAKLIKAEQGGITDEEPAERLKKFKKKARQDTETAL